MSSLGVALVTGASKGIGRAIALRLAKDGFDVGINDIPAARKGLESLRAQITEKGRNSTIAVGDVSMPPNVENMISTVVKDLGRLDVVSNHILNSVRRYFNAMKLDGGERGHMQGTPHHRNGGRRMGKTFRSECTRCLLVLQVCSIADDQARPRWKDYRSVFSGRKTRQYLPSSLINAASDPKFVGEASLGAYSATKFAVRGLTQAAATEWGRHGITVNAYCPGIIQTDIIQDIADGTKMLLDDVYTKFGAQSAVGRNGTVEDVANVVSFLASKDARLITGQGVAVDGGMQYS